MSRNYISNNKTDTSDCSKLDRRCSKPSEINSAHESAVTLLMTMAIAYNELQKTRHAPLSEAS